MILLHKDHYLHLSLIKSFYFFLTKLCSSMWQINFALGLGGTAISGGWGESQYSTPDTTLSPSKWFCVYDEQWFDTFLLFHKVWKAKLLWSVSFFHHAYLKKIFLKLAIMQGSGRGRIQEILQWCRPIHVYVPWTALAYPSHCPLNIMSPVVFSFRSCLGH